MGAACLYACIFARCQWADRSPRQASPFVFGLGFSSSDHVLGLVRKYLPTAEYPKGGKMSVAFHELVVGDSVEFKGPMGSFRWEGRGNIRWKDVPRAGVRNIGLICGGSGITPILQVLRSVLDDEGDEETRLWLLDANKTEADILCREELDRMVQLHSNASRPRLHVRHTLGAPSAGWSFSTGRINGDMLRRYLPPPSEDAMVLVCGPDGMVKTVRAGLEHIGWDIHRSLVVF
jgi:nitrate reductase (NAD(P)H)